MESYRESYRFSSYDEAIAVLQELKKNGNVSNVVKFTIDFSKNKSSEKTLISPDEGCVLIRKSKTIIINEDTYLPHMQLFSTKQSDLENIVKTGIMHDIIFPTEKEH